MRYAVIFMIFLSQVAIAGPGKFDSTEFNSIIQENQKQEIHLQKELQKSAGIELPNAKEMGKILPEHKVIENTVEQIAARTSEMVNSDNTTPDISETEVMKRVSQEVKAALEQ